eukprot:TRINITY_DN7596_c0_g1_i9.p2 TRINITY_DN7596_c0_g1~~TRINITY_DN7596_c0_g1_i9.p2  ORF type:complete len:228 (-),score=54.00 TRINITY_DN7596_c0_g1_i9:1213-1896(-)
MMKNPMVIPEPKQEEAPKSVRMREIVKEWLRTMGSLAAAEEEVEAAQAAFDGCPQQETYVASEELRAELFHELAEAKRRKVGPTGAFDRFKHRAALEVLVASGEYQRLFELEWEKCRSFSETPTPRPTEEKQHQELLHTPQQPRDLVTQEESIQPLESALVEKRPEVNVADCHPAPEPSLYGQRQAYCSDPNAYKDVFDPSAYFSSGGFVATTTQPVQKWVVTSALH